MFLKDYILIVSSFRQYICVIKIIKEMEKIDLENGRNKLLSLDIFNNKDEFIISLKIRLKCRVICNFFLRIIYM